MRWAAAALLFLVSCGQTTRSPSTDASSGGGGGSSGGNESCDQPRFVDPAVNAAVRVLAGGEPDEPWTAEAWSSVVGKTDWGLTIEGATSLSGLECLGRPAGALVLRGGRIDDFSMLAGWESAGGILSLEAGLELGSGALAGLEGSGSYPQLLEFHDLAIEEFPDVSALSHPLLVESHGTPLSSLSGLANSSVYWLLIRDAPLADVSALSTLSALENLDLGGTGVSELPDLSGLSLLDLVQLDDTAITALPTVGDPVTGCNGIQARRTQIDEAEARTQADALCARGWVVEVSMGDGPIYECGTHVCR